MTVSEFVAQQEKLREEVADAELLCFEISKLQQADRLAQQGRLVAFGSLAKMLLHERGVPVTDRSLRAAVEELAAAEADKGGRQ
jgi:hypothetical protein